MTTRQTSTGALRSQRSRRIKRPRVEDLVSSEEGGCVKSPVEKAPGGTERFRRPVPRYLVVRCEEEGKSFKEMSPFFIAKSLDSVCGKVTEARKMMDGTLLLNADVFAASKLLKCTSLGGIPVKVEPHKNLNTSKGVIFCFDLAFVSEEECKQEMASQGVVDCRKILPKQKGKPSVSMILTFATDKLPEKVTVGYNVCNVRAYIPNPLRCYNCHKFGHSSARCGKPTICGHCGQEKHDSDPCPNAPYCVNCKGGHPSSSRDCPTFLEEKKVQTIRTERKCSYGEAKRHVKLLAPPVFARSFAAVASVPVKKFDASTQTLSVSCSVQTEPVAVNKCPAPSKTVGEKTVHETILQAPKTGASGLDETTPVGGQTPSPPSPPKQEEIRTRISPVTAPQRENSVVAKNVVVPSREAARKEPDHHKGPSREPSQWVPVKNRSGKASKSLSKPSSPESMEVDPKPSTSIKLVRPRGNSPKPNR